MSFQVGVKRLLSPDRVQGGDALAKGQAAAQPDGVSLGQEPDIVALPNQKPKQAKPSPWYVRWGREALKIGAIIGVSTVGGLLGGVPGAIIAGASISGLVSLYEQKSTKGTVDFGTVGIDALIGAMPGGFGNAVGKIGGRLLSPFAKFLGARAASTVAAETVGQAMAKGALAGAVDGGAMGYAAGFAHTTYNTYRATGQVNLSEGIQAGADCILPGMIGGAVMAGGMSGIAKKLQGKSHEPPPPVAEKGEMPGGSSGASQSAHPGASPGSGSAPSPVPGPAPGPFKAPDTLPSVAEDAVHPLILSARQERQAWGESLELNPERFGPIHDHREGLLPSHAGGANIGRLNEVHLNTATLKEAGICNTIEEFSAHEGAHNYLANVRTALARQHPEVFEETTRKIVVNLTRNGEGGTILGYTPPVASMKGQFVPNIETALGSHPHLNGMDRTVVAGWVEDVLSEYSKCVYKAHKYDVPRLDPSALVHLESEIIPKLKDFMASGQYHSPQEAVKALQVHIDAKMPEFLKVRRYILAKVNNKAISPFMVSVPSLNAEERTQVARFLNMVLKHPEKHLEPSVDPYSMQLNAKTARQVERVLLPRLKDYAATFSVKHGETTALARHKALNELKDYIEAQVYRHERLRSGSITPRNEQLPSSVTVPLTPREVRHAKASLRGYLETLEGNIHLAGEGGTYSNEALMRYTFSWEELRARQTASRFRLGKTRRQVEALKAQGHTPETHPELAAAMERQTLLQNDLKLLKHARDYLGVERKINAAPKNLEVIRKLKLVQDKLDELGARLAEWKKRPAWDSKRIKAVEDLARKLQFLEAYQRSYMRPERLLAETPQKAALIAEQQRLLVGIQESADQTTLNSLPFAFYKSFYEMRDHKNRLQMDVFSKKKT